MSEPTQEMREAVGSIEFGAFRRTDPETSEAAAMSISVAELEAKVLEGLTDYPSGLTAHELSSRLGLALNTVSPRTAPLQRKGLVEDSGRRRKGPSGRNSIVWVRKERNSNVQDTLSVNN